MINKKLKMNLCLKYAQQKRHKTQSQTYLNQVIFVKWYKYIWNFHTDFIFPFGIWVKLMLKY